MRFQDSKEMPFNIIIKNVVHMNFFSLWNLQIFIK